MNKLTLFLFLIGIVLVSGCADSDTDAGDSMENIVKEGDYVKVDYIGELEDGTVFDTSIGREPLGFTVGAGQMIAGFDSGVVGMAVGEEKTLTLSPEEAYGEYSEEKVLTKSLEELESLGIFPAVGDKLGPQQILVLNVTDTEAKLDYNHKLAGKTLIFKVTLVSIGQE